MAAWDGWSEGRGQRLALSDGLATFVDQLIAQGVAQNATGVVMLALLRYAKVRDFLPQEDENES